MFDLWRRRWTCRMCETCFYLLYLWTCRINLAIFVILCDICVVRAIFVPYKCYINCPWCIYWVMFDDWMCGTPKSEKQNKKKIGHFVECFYHSTRQRCNSQQPSKIMAWYLIILSMSVDSKDPRACQRWGQRDRYNALKKITCWKLKKWMKTNTWHTIIIASFVNFHLFSIRNKINKYFSKTCFAPAQSNLYATLTFQRTVNGHGSKWRRSPVPTLWQGWL